MLAPHPGVRGPLPKHTPVLIEALTELGCEVVFEPWGRHHDRESIGEKLIGRAADIPRIRRRLIAEHFDVMVVKTSHEPRSLLRDVPLLAATRRLVPKIVVQSHGGRSDLLVAPGRLGFKLASVALFALSDGVLVLSTEEARESHMFWRRGEVSRGRQPVCAATAIAARPRGARSPATGRPRDAGDPVRGEADREKGIFEALSAFARVSASRNCRLVIAGDGPATGELDARIGGLGLEQKVTLTGFLEGDALQSAYDAADLFLLPSYREGFPTAISEAMAAGLPVVTTRTRGMADRLVAEENALFVAPGDALGLAAALERILDDPDMRARMSTANLAKVAEFAPDAVAKQYLATLDGLVGRSDTWSRAGRERADADRRPTGTGLTRPRSP